jgi:16S rRNA (uracil1498-N3)-methyltransferase
MADPRAYVDLEMQEGDIVTLPAPVYQHLVVVLRRIRGDTVTLFNGRGGEYGATIEAVARKTVTARVTQFRDVQRESPLQVTLGQAVSKGERMDYAIQKAVELGVTTIQPLVTDHVVVRLDAERWQRKREHWQSVAVSACEQSGRTRVPAVAPVVDLRDWINAVPGTALRLVLAPTGGVAAGTLKHGGQAVWLLVGPEGGLSEQESRLVDISGFTALSLGPRTLRSETAGVVALSVMQSLWGDVGKKAGIGS